MHQRWRKDSIFRFSQNGSKSIERIRNVVGTQIAAELTRTLVTYIFELELNVIRKKGRRMLF
jgi:hypothetical protein